MTEAAKTADLSKVINPKLYPDPSTIRFKELYKYTGQDYLKIGQSMRNYKGSLLYIGGILAGCLVFKGFVDSAVNLNIFGKNGNGGNFLTMYTQNNNYDYYYNREFQRMRYLIDEPSGDDPYLNTKDEILVDLGYKLENRGLNKHVWKKSPHYKYF